MGIQGKSLPTKITIIQLYNLEECQHTLWLKQCLIKLKESMRFIRLRIRVLFVTEVIFWFLIYKMIWYPKSKSVYVFIIYVSFIIGVLEKHVLINEFVNFPFNLSHNILCFVSSLFYKVDGFRFDLMGHIMKSTMVCFYFYLRMNMLETYHCCNWWDHTIDVFLHMW